MSFGEFWGLNEQGISSNEEPLYFRDSWDTFFIGKDQLPGFCWIENKDIAKVEVEKKKGKYSSGATITIQGYEPGSFDVVCRVVTEDQWFAFQVIRHKYWAGPGKKNKPSGATVQVIHPDLNSLRITQAVIIGFGLAEKSDVEGAKNFRIHFHEQVDKVATKAINAAGPPPDEDQRQPASAALNSPADDPADNAANMSLAGPPAGSPQ